MANTTFLNIDKFYTPLANQYFYYKSQGFK